jgi:hypothetical protein
MKGWYKTSKGIKYELYLDFINVSGMDITELVIPYGVKQIWCISNKLTELIIPDSIISIRCRHNNITELIVPDHCEVECDESVNIITRTMYNRSNRLKAILK